MTAARSIHVRGVVQGVGFRPFVYRLARQNSLAGWVLNEDGGVDIHLEGAEPALDAFLHDLNAQPPPAARIVAIEVKRSEAAGLKEFTIRESRRNGHVTVAMSPDLPVCEACLAEMGDPGERRYGYPYINCTNCGPRYSIIEKLSYDRRNTTMKSWNLDSYCSAQYHDPSDRRFHAQPVACPACGPHYHLETAGETVTGDDESVRRTAALLKAGCVVAMKGLGGYHLACDARNGHAVRALRERKFRKEKPFALMARTVEIVRTLVKLSPDAEALLISRARPIVLAPAAQTLAGVAPDNDELGVMLPYTPLHHLLFAAGCPDVLVMTEREPLE